MTSPKPIVTEPSKRQGRLVRLLNATAKGRLDFRSTTVERLDVDFEGIVGNRHRGFTRGADARVPYLKRGTQIRNTRQLSVVSVEDCAEIARRLDLAHFDPAWLGANVVIEGIPHLSYLARGARLFFEGGAIVTVEDQNAPCSIAGEAVMLANPGRGDIKLAFPRQAKGLRGLVVTVEHPGVLTAGGWITARLPEQWIYALAPRRRHANGRGKAMPHAVSNGVKIYFEEAGPATAPAILFCHEFGGDYRSWEDQMRYLGRNWRCITFSNRGYPRSDAPADEAAYGQDIANRDAIAILDHLKIAKAHVVGLSMGGYTTLMLAAKFPDRVLSCVAAGAGSGALKANREQFIAEARQAAAEMDKKGVIDAMGVGLGPTRVQLQNKDPRGWQQFVGHLSEHAAHAAAKTLRQVQASRASLYDLEAELKAIKAPTLLLVGDEDEPCLDVNLWMKRLIVSSRLGILPAAGHAINLEEPGSFNQLVERFLTQVDRGAWRPRDPRAVPGQAVGSLGVKRGG